MTSDTDIEQKIADIISKFKCGKDVTKDLVDIRSGGNYFGFHDWIIKDDIFMDLNFMLSVDDIPISLDDDYLDYFEEEDLNAKTPEEKIRNLSIEAKGDESQTIHYEKIDGVYVSVEAHWEGGKSGPHFHSLQISYDLKSIYDSKKEQGLLIVDSDRNSHNFSDDELVKIWDSFVAKVRGLKAPN